VNSSPLREGIGSHRPRCKSPRVTQVGDPSGTGAGSEAGCGGNLVHAQVGACATEDRRGPKTEDLCAGRAVGLDGGSQFSEECL